jgi:hypothetical protein
VKKKWNYTGISEDVVPILNFTLTFQSWHLRFKNRLELTFRDTVAVEDDTLRLRLFLFFQKGTVAFVLANQILGQVLARAEATRNILLRAMQLTYAIGSRSSIISWRDVCTRVAATYLDVAESTLATSEVKEGRPSEPGAGCITSAPMTIVGWFASFKNGAERESGIALIPPSLTFILENGERN